MTTLEADQPPLQAVQAGRPLRAAELLIEETLCVNLRSRHESCTACADACHASAIQPGLDLIEFDESACTTCAACLPACPSGALRLNNFHPARFIEAAAGHASLHLHCSQSRDGGGGMVVPCLSAIDARLMASLAGSGTREIRLHGLDQCTGCEHGRTGDWQASIEARLNDWLGPEALVLRRADRESLAGGQRERQDQARVSRRGFLKFAGLRAAQTVQQWVLPVARESDDAEERGFFQPGEQIQRPAAYQQILREAHAHIPWARDAVLPWVERRMTDACSACGICGQLCPTGALQTLDGAGSRTLSFDAGLCTSCEVCLNVCPTDAIQVSETLAPMDLPQQRGVVVNRSLQACQRCRQAVLAEVLNQGLCPICRNEQELDDEWLAMLQA